MTKQINLKLDLDIVSHRNFYEMIRRRDRKHYPSVLSYLLEAAETMEAYQNGVPQLPLLTDTDLINIRNTVLRAMQIYERTRLEETMVP